MAGNGRLCAQQSAEQPINFLRDIQPILADKCWKCHGVDENSRQAKLRLDQRDSAMQSKAIVVGDPSESKLMQRILASADDERMPPASSKKSLSITEIQLLTKWIEQGAPFARHWAFERPSKPSLPATKLPGWVSDPIDAFVLAEMEKQAMSPSHQADKATLLRRVTLDLTGLPPSIEELNTFLNDDSGMAYENAVDRLLNSRRYAERMAIDWLDAARYADTNGYNNDEDRTMWPWRDWVIDAFDCNMPYNQFVVEQLAGDLLTNATLSQKLATGFHRNLGHNTEGGIIQEEYRVEYVADRVHTTSTIFMGLSMQCARCHDHKYDPISQREYYQFYAFFNQMDEKQASYSKFKAAGPFVALPSKSDQIELDLNRKRVQLARVSLAQLESDAESLLEDWIQRHSVAERQALLGQGRIHQLSFDSSTSPFATGVATHPIKARCLGNVATEPGRFGHALSLDGQSAAEFEDFGVTDGSRPYSVSVWVFPRSNQTMAVYSKMDESDHFRGYDLLLEDGKATAHFIHKWPDLAIKVKSKTELKLEEWQHLLVSYNGKRTANGVRIYLDGKELDLDVVKDKLNETIHTSKPFHLGQRETSQTFTGSIDELQIYDQELSASDAEALAAGKEPLDLAELLATPHTQRSPRDRAKAKDLYLKRIDSLYPKLQSQIASLEQEKIDIDNRIPAVMVMQDMDSPRETFVLKRGQYDQPSERVSAQVPSALSPMEPSLPRNRLGLAQWLVAPNHPLTARVAVNRWWQMFFGNGIVRTTEDFGITGEPPSHPALLDYLATELIDSQWNVKRLLKRIVMTSTYRQDSNINPQHWERDPENRLLARGARFRLPAETIRDNALAIAGLLSDRVGGPSVKPYQPDGLWEDVTVERRGKYVLDQGADLYRRSMYTFWKRTCPPPSMMSFDAPNREVCLARRARTNTPLQSLVLLNDPTYVEAARKLAERMIGLGGEAITDRIAVGYRLCLARKPRADESDVLTKLFTDFRSKFNVDPKAADQLLSIGRSPREPSIDPVELAAWTMIASTLLNLDETITKR